MGGQWGKPHHKKGGLEGGMPILKFANILPTRFAKLFMTFYTFLRPHFIMGQVLQYLCNKTVKPFILKFVCCMKFA
jgi:hypothetical protein